MELYIFGASKKGQISYEFLKDEYEIKGFIDNDINKVGRKLHDREIFSIDDIKDLNAYIIIGSMFIEEIEIQLKELNYSNFKTLEQFIIEKVIFNPKEAKKYFERNGCFLDYNLVSSYLLKNIYTNQITENLLYDIVQCFKPIGVNIECVRGCNLKCPLCQLQEDYFKNNVIGEKQGIMSNETFKKIVDELPVSICTSTLHLSGEPLLDKDIFKKAKILKEKRKNLQVGIDTNLSLDFDPFELVNSGLDYLQVSFDGYTQETYSKYRVNGNFEKVMSNISRIKAVKKMLNVNTPKIMAKTILFKYLIENKDYISNLALSCGADHHHFLSNYINDNYNENVRLQEWIPEEQEYTVYDVKQCYENNKLKLYDNVKKSKHCMRMQAPIIIIDYLGNVYPCCRLIYEKYNMGNINVSSFEEIWNSKKFIDFRVDVLLNREKYEDCALCMMSDLK